MNGLTTCLVENFRLIFDIEISEMTFKLLTDLFSIRIQRLKPLLMLESDCHKLKLSLESFHNLFIWSK